MKILVIGGGAAGFFAAITCAEQNPMARVMILDKNSTLLSKVKISGGGRCNVTHACFDAKRLVTFYPRGERALLGPFHSFQPKDTVHWFESRGVKIKTEDDGRMFPITNDSQTIIDCLKNAAHKAGVQVHGGVSIASVARGADGLFKAKLVTREEIDADRLLLATGSNPQGLHWAENMGHTLVPPVPSLFTFTIVDPRIANLSGISVDNAAVALENSKLEAAGPLLITHWGLSGPAALKLSAFGAREFHKRDYKTSLRINWISAAPDAADKTLAYFKTTAPKKVVHGHQPYKIPQRLWVQLAVAAGIGAEKRWADASKDQLRALARELTAGVYSMTGKSAFKDEFVTAGGVSLDEVNFKTLESKKCPGLFFAGEILDVDGVTGGFNFQNAWTTGYLAGKALAAEKNDTKKILL
jgi:predicted Rossmann fold flavoprotein